MRFLYAALGIFGAGASLTCGGNTPHEGNALHVLSYAPHGPVEAAQPVQIQFDRPVVAADMVGKPADPTTVKVTPAFPWTGVWKDRQTLVLQPTAPLAPSTRYEVTLTGELAKRTDDFSFTFIHQPLELDTSTDSDQLGPNSNVPLTFNQPVSPVAAASHCRLEAGDTRIALQLDKDTAPAKHFALKPAHPLEPASALRVVCEDLTGEGGNAPIAAPIALDMHVRDGLSIADASPRGDDVSPDGAQIQIVFSTPVKLDDIRAHLHADPPIRGLDQGWMSYDGTQYQATADLDPHVKYKITVDDGLVNALGDKLAAAWQMEITTTDARGRLSMERGIFAVEASAKGYPLWSRNLSKYTITCAEIPKDHLVALLAADMSYDPWSGVSDQNKTLDWAKYGARKKVVERTYKEKNVWHMDDVDLGATCGSGAGKRGVYLAEVKSDDIQPDPQRSWMRVDDNRVLANVTDLGVMIQVGTASGLVWVTSLASGQPVANAAVTVYDPGTGKQVWSGKSDADGIARMPGSATLKPEHKATDEELEYGWYNYREQRLVAVVETSNDLAVVDGNWSNGIQSWNFGVPEDRSGGKTRIRGFIESDRGLYRPGEQVHFKGIAREVAANKSPRPPARQPVKIQVMDSRGQAVLTTTANLSAFGGFAWDLQLSPDASLGDYYVTANVGGQPFNERFTVEEFRPAAFELALAAKKQKPSDMSFDLTASYLFGSPLTNAKVDWSVRKRRHHISFEGFEEYTFSDNPRDYWWYYRDGEYGEFIGDGQGQTDDKGHLEIEAKDENRGTGPIDYVVTTAVTDSSDQTINKSAVITSHETSMYLGVHANEYVQAVGMPFGVNLVAMTPDGKRTAAKAHLQFIRSTWQCIYDYHGARSYSKCDESDKVMQERDVDIAGAGSHTERIEPTEPGEYIVKVTAKDDAGRDVAAASQLWVIGKGEAWWNGDEGARMTIVASRPNYQVGDTARLVPMANLVRPTALITVERDGILEARVQKMDSASEGITLPITDAYAPNVFAGVAMVSGRHGPLDKDRPQFKMGKVALKVSSAGKQLDVKVALDRDVIRPGEQVSGKITVTSHGAPVSAEVALSAADEGVLQLIDYQTPNPMKTFYAEYGLGVDAATNWNRLARRLDPDANDPDQGGDMASRLNGGKVRSKFVASAYWSPMLVTNDKGEVTFSFKAPDNLGAFRLMAVAADAGDRFGAGDKRLTLNKPLMATPVLSRFLRQGDKADVGVVVHNTTDAQGTVVVTAAATGVTLDGSAAQSVVVAAHGEARVTWAAAASGDADKATFEFSADMGRERDAVEVALPIEKARIKDTRMLAEQQVKDSWKGALGLGGSAIRKESTLSVSIDRTGVGSLGPSLNALVEYPYGCLEQTMSRFMPLVAAKDLSGSLDQKALEGGNMERFIKIAVAKVIRHQQADGLFSLWPTSETYPHLAAYALWGLTVAQQQAHEEVPADVFDRGIAALTKWTNDPKNLTPDGTGATMAMAAYVMALRGKPNAGLDARLYDARAGLPVWGQAFLLRAMKLAKADGRQVATLEADLAKRVTVDGSVAKVVENTKAGDDFEMYMGSDARATAMTLAALLEVDPQSKLIDPLAAGLMGMRDQGGAWRSTQDNLWALLALAQYARRTPASGELDATVTVGGKKIAVKHVSGTGVATFVVPLGDTAGDDVAVSVSSAAHVSARVTEAKVDAGAAESHGFTIARTYRDENGFTLKSVKAGQLVTVQLDVTIDAPHRWVAIVDPLPAGFEPVNDKLNSGASADPSKASRPDRWRWMIWADYVEQRDDRVMWFADRVWSGSYQMTYQARATMSGEFSVAPASIEAMYQPEIHARTAAEKITISR